MKKGFTLIELVVAIGIIAILAGLILVRISGTSMDSRNSKREADLDQSQQAINMFKVAGGSINPCTNCPGDCVSMFSPGANSVNFIQGFAPNYPNGYLSTDDYPKDPKEDTYYHFWRKGCGTGTYWISVPQTEPKDGNTDNDIKIFE